MLAKALFTEAERPTDNVNLSLGCLPAFVGFAAVGLGQVLARRIVKSKAQPA